MKFPGFIGASYTSKSVIGACERCVNWYPEVNESPFGRRKIFLYPTPGYNSVVTLAESPCRGLFALDGRAFAIMSNVLYELTEDTAGVITGTSRGTVVNSSDLTPATISSSGDGGNELFITSGDKGYIFNLLTNTLTEELSSGSDIGAYLDGFFISLDTATSTFQISDLRDGTTWDPTQVAQRLAGSDKWVSMLVSGGVIWLFGSITSEVWYNAGTSPFPFALIPGAVIQQGILAPRSAVSLGAIPMWLGSTKDGDAIVYQAGSGFAAQRISTHALEAEFRSYVDVLGARLDDAIGWSYQEDGHLFYVLEFPTAQKTWVYDVATTLWHERGYWNTVDGQFENIRARYHMYVFDKHLVGDRASGQIYQQSTQFYSDVDDANILRIRRAPHPSTGMGNSFYPCLTVLVETGVGVSGSGEASNPVLMLKVSDDGGRTWWQAEDQTIGRIGEYQKLVQWYRLGMAQDRAYEISCSDKVPVRLIDADLQQESGYN